MEPTTTAAELDARADTPPHDVVVDEVEDDLLVEEISIDGMCGVY